MDEQIRELHFKLGSAYLQTDRFEEALGNYMIALDFVLKREGENSIEASNVYGNIAIVYQEMKDHVRAIEYFQRVHDIISVRSDTEKEQFILHNNMGRAYFEHKRYADAVKHFDQALQLAESMPASAIAVAERNRRNALECLARENSEPDSQQADR